jgi:hypothetical protein
MARRRRQEENIPVQDRYPRETAANQMIDSNFIPTSEINSNATFPMPKPGRAGDSTISYQERPAEFITESHTNGKK